MTRKGPPAAEPTRNDRLSSAAAAARLAVGAVFLASGLEKAGLPLEELAAVIQGYAVLPEPWLPAAAAILPVAEVLLGLALISGYLTRAASAASGALSLVFIAALASTLARGIPLPDCGCFGHGVHFSVPEALGLDTGLLCLSYLAYRKGEAFSWLDRWIERGSRPSR